MLTAEVADPRVTDSNTSRTRTRTHVVRVQLHGGHLFERDVSRPAVPAAAQTTRKHRSHPLSAPTLATHPETSCQTNQRACDVRAPPDNSDTARREWELHKPPALRCIPDCIQSQRLTDRQFAPDGMETREENQGQNLYT